jgi:hypothetical protein
MRRSLLLMAALAGGCATLTPEGSGVLVYRAPLEAQAAPAPMPEGCRKLAETHPVNITELELESDKHPYLAQQNQAAAAGANVLLVRSRELIPRRTYDCPASSRITDCPFNSGAWYRVVFESYTCSADGLRSLPPIKAAPRQP